MVLRTDQDYRNEKMFRDCAKKHDEGLRQVIKDTEKLHGGSKKGNRQLIPDKLMAIIGLGFFISMWLIMFQEYLLDNNTPSYSRAIMFGMILATPSAIFDIYRSFIAAFFFSTLILGLGAGVLVIHYEASIPYIGHITLLTPLVAGAIWASIKIRN